MIKTPWPQIDGKEFVQNRKEDCRADSQRSVREVVHRDGQAVWAALGFIQKKGIVEQVSQGPPVSLLYEPVKVLYGLTWGFSFCLKTRRDLSAV